MKDEKRVDAEEEIKQTVLISRDRALQSQEFRDLFQGVDEYEFNECSSHTRQLWAHLLFLVSIIRKRPGASMDELVAVMSLDAREIRKCIRLLITLGGEIQVICEDWQCPNEGRFLLHN